MCFHCWWSVLPLSARKWTFIFQCLWSELFPYGQPMHTTAGSGGVSVRERRGLWVPRKQTTGAMCVDIHASERTQEDYDGTSVSGLLSPAAHSGGTGRICHWGGCWYQVHIPALDEGRGGPTAGGNTSWLRRFHPKAAGRPPLSSSPSNSVSPVSSSLLPGKVHPFQQPQPLRAPPPPLLPWRTGCYFLDKHWILTFSYWEYPCHTQKSYCKCHVAEKGSWTCLWDVPKPTGAQGSPSPNVPLAQDYFELNLLKKQPAQEGHPDSLSLWKQDIHLSCERCSPWVWR